MHLVDHLFIFMLFVVQPIHGAMAYRRVIARIEAGEPSNRIKLYRQTQILEWTAFAVLALAWALLSRPIASLGFVVPAGSGFVGGILVLLLATGYLVYTVFAARRMSETEKASQVEAFGTLRHFLPQNDRDYRHFVGISVTAGIVEEIIYRGFAFWYLAHFMPLWAVVVVSSLAFGLGHSYQGSGGMLRVTAIGLAFGAFYVWTGSIWLPMLAHAILDIVQGAAILEMLRNKDNSPQAQPA